MATVTFTPVSPARSAPARRGACGAGGRRGGPAAPRSRGVGRSGPWFHPPRARGRSGRGAPGRGPNERRRPTRGRRAGGGRGRPAPRGGGGGIVQRFGEGARQDRDVAGRGDPAGAVLIQKPAHGSPFAGHHRTAGG